MVAMADATSKFTTIVERYLSALRELRVLPHLRLITLSIKSRAKKRKAGRP